MELVLDRDAFLRGLQMVQNIVEPRQTLPILANVLIRKTGNQVELTTSDLEIQVRTTVQFDGDAGNLNTTVGARKLIDILQNGAFDRTIRPAHGFFPCFMAATSQT